MISLSVKHCHSDNSDDVVNNQGAIVGRGTALTTITIKTLSFSQPVDAIDNLDNLGENLLIT